MFKHKHLLYSFLASIILLTYTMNSYAKDCFSGHEAKEIESELIDSWWTPKEQRNLHISLSSSHLVPENGGQCIVLIESRGKNDTCHACPADLGIAIYFKSGNKWSKTFEQNAVGKFGQSGELPEVTLVKVGQNNYGIMLHDNYMAQGNYSERHTLVAKVNRRYKDLISIVTSAGGLQTDNFEAHYYFIEGINKHFFDIKVVSEVTKEHWEEGKMEFNTLKETKVYKFVHDKYELIENKSDIETHTREYSEDDFINKVQEPFVPLKKITIKGDKESYFKIFGTLVENNPRLQFLFNHGNSYEPLSIPLEKVAFRLIMGIREPKMRIIVGEVNDKCIRLYKTDMISFIEDNVCVKGISVQVDPDDIVPQLTTWTDL